MGGQDAALSAKGKKFLTDKRAATMNRLTAMDLCVCDDGTNEEDKKKKVKTIMSIVIVL